MADFLLSVGVDVGLSYDQMQKDISSLVSQLNSNPASIKVKFDEASLSTMRSQLSDIGIDCNMAGVAANAERAANATRAAKAEFQSTQEAVKTLSKGSKEYYNALRQVQNLLIQVTSSQEKWTAAKKGKSSASYNDLSIYASELTQLITQLQAGAMSADKFNTKLAEIRANVATASGQIKDSGEATRSWTQRIEGLSAKFGTWFSITRVIMAAYRAIREMVSAVIELDTAMTELKKVTNETDAVYEKFLVNATGRAKTLGADLADTVSATADFARLGFEIEDAEKLADAAIVYKNVGDDIEDISTASESIIATMQAFSDEIDPTEVMTIVDKFNEVGNNYAISSKGVGEALLRSAAAMHAANNSLDETIALAAAANTIIQDPEKVGTTLKTVSMYLRAAKTEAEGAGESTEGMANSVSELRDEILRLTGNKVDIQIDEDTFKSTYQILQELSQVWGELTDISQANILEMVGGKRNSNVVAALLENFTVAEKAMKTSAESAGSALEENEKVLESIQGKLNIMKAEFQTFAQNLIGSEPVKFIVDFATGVLNVLNGVSKVIKALGGLKTVLMAVASALLIAKGGLIAYKIQTLLAVDAVKKIITFCSTMKNGIMNIFLIIPKAIKAWKAYAAATVSASAAMKAANSVIGLVLGVLTVVVAAYNMYQDSIKEAQQATIDTAKESTDHIKELESAMKSYLELDTTATEADKASALKSVTEQLNNKTKALKNATEAEKGYKDAVIDSIEADYRDAAGKANDAAVAAKEKIAGQWTTDYTREIVNTGESESVYNEIKGILGDYIEASGGIYGIKRYRIGLTVDGFGGLVSTINTNDTESLLAYYEKLQQAQYVIQQKALELGDAGDALLESSLYKSISEILNFENNKTNIGDYITNRAEAIYSGTIASQGVPETAEQFQDLKDAMLGQAGNSQLLADAIVNRLNGAFGSLAEEAVKAEKSVSSLDFVIDTETLTKQLETQQEEISKIADNYKKISGVIDDYNKNGSLSIDNLETLISVGDEYVSTLFDENGKLNLNKDSYKKLAKAKLEDIRYSMLENAISSLNQLSKDDETSANNELAESTGKLTEETLRLVAVKKLAEGVDSTQIQSIINTYSQWSALIDNTEAGLENNIDATLGLESASNKLKDSLENEKKALEDTKNGYEKAVDSIKSLIDWTENYIKQTKEDEIDALEEKKSAVDDLIDKQKELLEAEKDEYDWNKEIADKQNSVAKNALAASIASLDDSSAGKKAYKEAIDTLSESRSDMTDALYEHSIDTRMDALDKLKEQSDEYYDSEIDKINEFLNDEVALYKAACSMIDNDNGTLYGNLLNYCKTYTTTSEAEFNHMWTSAQSAMQQYNIANLDTFSLLNNLQGCIYEVDGAIETIANSISSYEDKISGVQNKLDSLSNSARSAISNIDDIKDISDGKTTKNGRLAANELTKLMTKIVQDSLGVAKNKVHPQKGFKPLSTGKPSFNFPHYAKGTRNAKGGLTNIDEEGLYSELIPYQTGEGRYIILPEGNPVFSKLMTNRLFDFASNPFRYLQHIQPDFGGRIIPVNKQTQITPSINITVQGDATQSTVNALKTEASKIIDKATKNVMNIALRNKRLI